LAFLNKEVFYILYRIYFLFAGPVASYCDGAG